MTTTPDMRIYKHVNDCNHIYHVLDFDRPYSHSIIINYVPSQEFKHSRIQCSVGEMVIRVVKSIDQSEVNCHTLYSYCESTFLELLIVAGITKGQLEQGYKEHSTEDTGATITLW